MSWSEIKKAVNNNLDIPLNELLSVGETMLFKYIVSNSLPNSSWNTLLDVSNSQGVIDAIFVNQQSNTTSAAVARSLKVTLDGELIENVTLSGTSSSYQSPSYLYLNIDLSDVAQYTGFSTVFKLVNVGGTQNLTVPGDSTNYPRKEMSAISHTIYRPVVTAFTFTKNGLRFKKSLKIEVTNTAAVQVCYRLF